MILGLAFIFQPEKSITIPQWIHVNSGEFTVGKKEYIFNPIRKTKLAGFDLADKDVTNAEFSRFVKDTKYVTDAEKRHDANVFEPPMPEFRWKIDKTAFWRFPNGRTRGGITDKMTHPVTSISYADAEAYCKWAGYRLPTLDEWEVASRAGSTTDYFWGDDWHKIKAYANVWLGRDHTKADKSDGYMYTSPVGSFHPNPLGLYDIYGNVFQFCSGKLESDTSRDQVHARGGSWWCSYNACCFFNSVDIGTVDRHSTFSNQGFRVARSNNLDQKADRLH